jgi:hypothetical protein
MNIEISLKSVVCLTYMTTKKTQEQILKEYEEKSEAILQKMMQILPGLPKSFWVLTMALM